MTPPLTLRFSHNPDDQLSLHQRPDRPKEKNNYSNDYFHTLGAGSATRPTFRALRPGKGSLICVLRAAAACHGRIRHLAPLPSGNSSAFPGLHLYPNRLNAKVFLTLRMFKFVGASDMADRDYVLPFIYALVSQSSAAVHSSSPMTGVTVL